MLEYVGLKGAYMKKLLLTFVVSVLVGSIATSLYIKNKTEKVELVEGYQINHKMPHFELKTLVGEDFDFKTVEGKNVVLNFFASWCPYCKEETPHLMTLQENHQDDLVVLMVNLNVLEERLEDVSTFQKVLDVTLPILMDETGDFMKKFGIRGTPIMSLSIKTGLSRKLYQVA